VPTKIVHLWSVKAREDAFDEVERFKKSQDEGFYSLIFLARAFGKQFINDPLEIICISSEVQDVTGVESLSPEKSTLLGPCKVIPQEYMNINVRSLDILADEWRGPLAEKHLEQLVADLQSQSADLFTAYRDGKRLVQ